MVIMGHHLYSKIADPYSAIHLPQKYLDEFDLTTRTIHQIQPLLKQIVYILFCVEVARLCISTLDPWGILMSTSSPKSSKEGILWEYVNVHIYGSLDDYI